MRTLVAPCVLACRAGVFWREPRALTPPSWINRRAERVNNVPEGDRDGPQKKGTGEEKENRYGERFSVIINRIVSTYTGNVLRMIMKKHLFDV